MPQFESLENKLMNIVRKPIYIHVTIFIIIYIVLSLISTWLQLIGKFPPRYDIFWFDNAIYNTLHGNGFFTILPDHYSISVKNLYPLISHFHQHNQPILFFLLPIYDIFQSVYTLFIVQSIFIGLAAIPLYLVGKEVLDEISCKIIAISYLIYPFVFWNSLLFYPESITPFFIFLMIYFYIKEKFWLFCLSFFFVLILKEDLPVVLFPLGLYLLYDAYKEKYFSQNITGRLKYLLLIIIISPLYFIFSFKIIIAHFTGGAYSFTSLRYGQFGNSVSEIVRNAIVKPGLFTKYIASERTLFYLIQMLLQISFVPLLSITTFAVGMPTILENVLANTITQTVFTEHYQFGLTTVLFLSTIVGFAKIRKKNLENYEIWKIRFMYLSIFWFIIFLVIRVYLFSSPLNYTINLY